MAYAHLGDRSIKARKPHQCYLCGESIEAGETYVRRTSAADDGINRIAMHPECEEESQPWGWWEWEEFMSGDMPRPKRCVVPIEEA